MRSDDYCRKCGTPTVTEYRKHKDFDPREGTPVGKYRTRCPNKRFPLDGHSNEGWSYNEWKEDY